MEEWRDKYNPFNSWKSLVHSAHYEKIIEADNAYSASNVASVPILPPIIVNFDLTNECNYDCRFCMFANRLRADPTSQTFRGNKDGLPKGYALKLPKLWKEWGIKAECLGGGGDPTLHPDCLPHMIESAKHGIHIGFVSNGFLVNNETWWDTIVKSCKWVGFSVDAGNAKDYAATKGVPDDYFYRVLDNLRGLVEAKKRLKTNCNIGFKFLLDEMNYTSIYEAAKIAKQIGCNTFQFRPAINPNNIFFYKNRDLILKQIEDAQKDFDCETYKVHGVIHKFNLDFSKKHDFKKCRATMLSTTWCADGRVYMCTDTRGNPWAYLTNHYPNPENAIKFWGSNEHWDKIKKIDFCKNCDRCTLAMPNEFFEKVFIEDRMERNLV